MDLVGLVFPWPHNPARIQYFLQAATLAGVQVCYVAQAGGELLMNLKLVEEAVKLLVDENIVLLVEHGHSFKLVLPKAESARNEGGAPETAKP